MPRVLLLMTARSYRADAFLEAAGILGLETAVATDRPQTLALAQPSRLLHADFTRPDRAAAELERFAARHPVDAVVSCEDEGTPLAARLAAALGLPHASPEAVGACRDKSLFRARLAAAGVPSPAFRRMAVAEGPAAVAGEVSYPCVLKPLHLSASRGVLRADDPAAFRAAFERIARLLSRPEIARLDREAARWILAESYLPGPEVAVEALVSAGRPRILAVFDKPDPLEGPVFEETIYLTPSRRSEAELAAVERSLRRTLEAVGLAEGPVHAELRLHRGEAWPLEAAPRTIGGRCSRTLRFAGPEEGRAMSLEELLLRHALGLPGAEAARLPEAAGVMMIPVPRGGRLREVRGREEAVAVPGVEALEIHVPRGGEILPLPEGSRYLGFLFARAASPARAEAALREAHARLEFVIDPRGDEA